MAPNVCSQISGKFDLRENVNPLPTSGSDVSRLPCETPPSPAAVGVGFERRSDFWPRRQRPRLREALGPLAPRWADITDCRPVSRLIGLVSLHTDKASAR